MQDCKSCLVAHEKSNLMISLNNAEQEAHSWHQYAVLCEEQIKMYKRALNMAVDYFKNNHATTCTCEICKIAREIKEYL